MITAGDSLNKALKLEGLKDHEDMLALMPAPIGKIMNYLSFPTLSRIAGGTWNVESIADGLNYLNELAKQEQCFFKPWSEAETVKDPSKAETKLIAFRKKEKSKVAVVIPGGAYVAVASIVEGFPVAKRLNQLGYSAFVLKYRCAKNAVAPNPMDDLAAAVRYLLVHAEEWNLDMDDYLVVGFSAGGHLAASYGTECLGYAHYGLPKPGAMILGYPVIMMDAENTHAQSRNNLLGTKKPSAALIEKWSINQQITDSFPKSYVWQCDRDNTVPVRNSAALVDALREHGVEVQYETFSSDAHGWGLGERTLAEGWLDRAIAFAHQEKRITEKER